MDAMTAPCPITKIVKRNGNIVAYDRERIATAIFKAAAAAGQPDRNLADSVAEKVEEALIRAGHGSAAMPTVEEIQDTVEETLIEHRQTRIARNYIIYRHERAMARAAKSYSFEVTDNIPYKKIYNVLLWNMAHGCGTVDDLNALLRDGGLPELISAAEQRYADEIGLAARQMLQRLDTLRLVIVAGPSSSGKTTTLIKIAERLQAAGVAFKPMNLDNYFFDLDQHPRDEFGDYDYEAPQSLDIELIDQHLAALLAGHGVRTPAYDFKTGKRTLEAQDLRLADREVLLIDSLHGLYEPMTRSVPHERKFRLYVETLGQLRAADGTFMRWADHRMLRRMLRDRDQRNSQPLETIAHWQYVRRSELKFIIPYIHGADCVLDTALPYELPILKHKLQACFPQAIERFRDDPRRHDASVRAKRVLALLEPLAAVTDDSVVPPTSVFREFIGGSAYTY